ncbi:hypothetical protein [Inquilinus limosus]|uniref:hypothetical protein n=1 Tax=Inquilinus limosus TaxID=171674 RepID=UPI00054D5235|nr:hypothetical protein [Inquilinus limosus]
MPLPALHRRIVGLLRPHRSSASYWAGSLVLADLLDRPPGDFDIHHRCWPDASRAMACDHAALAAAGFIRMGLRDDGSECEATYALATDPDVSVVLNWVVDQAPVGQRAFPDQRLGFAAHRLDVAARKLAMAVESGDGKHVADLAALERHGIAVSSLVGPALTLQSALSPAEFRAACARLGFGILRGVRPPPERVPAA